MRKMVGATIAGLLAVGAWAGPAAAAKADKYADLKVPTGTTLEDAFNQARIKAQTVCDTKGVKRAHIVVLTPDFVRAEIAFTCSVIGHTSPITAATIPKHYTPVPTDFQIGIIVLSQQCFGDAGCDLTFRINVNYVGAAPPDPEKTFTVTYDIAGGDAPQSNHFTMHGSTVTGDSQESIQTPPNPALTATPTHVLVG